MRRFGYMDTILKAVIVIIFLSLLTLFVNGNGYSREEEDQNLLRILSENEKLKQQNKWKPNPKPIPKPVASPSVRRTLPPNAASPKASPNLPPSVETKKPTNAPPVGIKPRKYTNLQLGDLGLRFSKIVFTDGVPSGITLPLTYDSYPISGALANILKESECPSVMTPDDFEVTGVNIDEYIDLVDGYPPYANSNSTSPFWDDFREVVRLQVLRKNNELTPASEVMDLPDLYKNYTLYDVSRSVHSEYPGSNQAEYIKVLLGPDLDKLNLDHNVIPRRCKNEFLRGPFLMAELNTWATSMVGPTNFLMKYHVGQARPEEVAWQIANGILTTSDGVPDDIARDITSLNLVSPEDFTAYPEGSPRHPSWPAMHSAASCSSFWLSVVLNLTPEQLKQAKLMDWSVSYARSVAGVHYPSDNIAGLTIGQEVVARKLADFLVSRFNSNRTAVDEKIKKMRFDWNNFDP